MTAGSVGYVALVAQWTDEREDLLPVIERVMSSGNFIGGGEVESFERTAAELTGSEYCVALNSGTDALVLGLAALGVGRGHEVITPPNSFVASTAAIVHLGATPVFADVLADQNIDPERIRSAITTRTKAIMPVHLTGRVAQMDSIMEIARDAGIPVIEDAAQSIGSQFRGRPSGSFGRVGCFSAHPLKNLNACGDAGFLTTNDPEIAEFARTARNHGLVDRYTVQKFGYVSRMDALQAAILNFRASRLNAVSERRRENAAQYRSLLDPERVSVPQEKPWEINTYHTFVIQCDRRDELQAYLAEHGIETAIHYPLPIHLQPAAAALGYRSGDFPVTELQASRILTLPVHQYLSSGNVAGVAERINCFYAKSN